MWDNNRTPKAVGSVDGPIVSWPGRCVLTCISACQRSKGGERVDVIQFVGLDVCVTQPNTKHEHIHSRHAHPHEQQRNHCTHIIQPSTESVARAGGAFARYRGSQISGSNGFERKTEEYHLKIHQKESPCCCGQTAKHQRKQENARYPRGVICLPFVHQLLRMLCPSLSWFTASSFVTPK